MIELKPHELGVLLPVKAQPGASNNGVRGEQNGMLKVSVTQVAEKGKANKAIVAVLAKELKLRKSQIELMNGTTASEKTFLIRDCTPDELERRLAAVLG